MYFILNTQMYTNIRRGLIKISSKSYQNYKLHMKNLQFLNIHTRIPSFYERLHDNTHQTYLKKFRMGANIFLKF